MTLVEKSPKSAEANIFLELAQKLQTQPVLYAAAPLSEEQMELFMRWGKTIPHYHYNFQTYICSRDSCCSRTAFCHEKESFI